MAESSAFLMRSMSQPSPTSSEGKKANHLHRALTTSVSFGRFMSESLDWVKWSAFTQNRYMEEVEKYSKPGSVAEKKAYFEAHFKRRRAAALVEQQNAESNPTTGDPSEANEENKVEDTVYPDLDLAQGSSCAVAKNTNEEEIRNSCQLFPVSEYDASAKRMVEDVQFGKSTRSPVRVSNHLEKDGCVDDDKLKLEDKASDKGDLTVGTSAISTNKIPIPPSMPLKTEHAPKCAPSPSPVIMPIQLRNSEKTPDSKFIVTDPGNKRRSYTTSLHMSMNLASCLGETHKPTSQVRPKIENISLSRAPVRRFKNSMRSQTLTTEPANGTIFKHHVGITQHEKRTVSIHNNPLTRSRVLDGKVQAIPSTKCSKSSATFGFKARLPTVACPFTFKSEERAAKRKEKLEQKSSQKEKPIPQVKARDSFKHPHSSIATTKPEILPSTDLSNNVTKKIPTVRHYLPRVEERASFKALDNIPRPPWRFSVKNEGSSDATTMQNMRLPIDSSTKLFRKSMNENASPNIQV